MLDIAHAWLYIISHHRCMLTRSGNQNLWSNHFAWQKPFWVTAVTLCVQETFAKEGLDYSMDGKTGSTLNSHRLIALAGQQGLDKQDQLVELLFKAYFTQVGIPPHPSVLYTCKTLSFLASVRCLLPFADC